MPSKTNERFIRADRKNRIENVRLQQVKKLFDRSKSSLSLEIEREKRIFAKSFEVVKRTSGVSEQGIPPKNENDKDYENSPNYRMGLRLSEMRLLEWKNSEKQLGRFLTHCEAEMSKPKNWRRHSSPDMNSNTISKRQTSASRRQSSAKATNSSSSCGIETETTGKNDDDVFYDDWKNSSESTEIFTLDAEKLEKEITEQYKALFSNTKVKIDRYSKKINRKNCADSDTENIERGKRIQFRPHTASAVCDKRRKVSTQSLPVRPSTAHASQPPYTQSFIIAKDGAYINTGKRYRKIDLDIHQNICEQNSNSFEKESTELDAIPLPVVNESSEETNESDIVETDNGAIEDPRVETDNGAIEDPRVETDNGAIEDSSCGIINMIIEEEDSNNTENGEQEGTSPREASQNDFMLKNKRRVSLIRNDRKRSNTITSLSEVESMSSRPGNDETSSYLSRLVSARQRFGSTSTLMSDQGHSFMSEMYGSTSDMSIGSDGQRRPSRWRQFVGADKVTLPSKKLATVGAVVKAALAFSKSARKKALDKLVEEQSADSRELIRQERLRRLESRNNVLSTIASQWGLNPDMNSVEEVAEET